jgi:hypothetical protein
MTIELTTVEQVKAVYRSIFRTDLNDSTATAVATSIDNGTTSLETYQAGLIAQTTKTTQAAFALSSFIEGVVPTSARIDSLTEFAKTQFDYYANVLKSDNAQLGAYEALGKAFAADASTSAAFEARYGALSATDFVITAYAQIFDNAASTVPSDAALANLVGQIEYFTGIYVEAGIPAADAALQAKGAVLGQIIGYAFTDATRAGESSLQLKVAAAISEVATDAATGAPSDVYGSSILAANITITGDVGPAVTDPLLKSTIYNDKIAGTLGVTSFTSATKIDGGLGVDELTITTATGNAEYAPEADVVKSIEKVTVVTAGDDATVTLTNVKGLTDVTFGAGSTTGLSLVGLDAATAVHVAATEETAGLVLGYASAPAAAKISIDANYTGTIAFSDEEVKSVTVDVTAAASDVNFTGSALESVTVTSKGTITVDAMGVGLTSLDLTGVGTYATVNLGCTTFDDAVTVKLGKGADVLTIAGDKAHSVTLGAGADTLKVLATSGNVDTGSAADLAASALVVTDFSKTDLDILKLDGLRTSLDSTQLGQISGSADLLAAASLAANFADAGEWAVFSYGSDTYLLNDLGDSGLDAQDTLVKLTGFQLSDFNASNLVFSAI